MKWYLGSETSETKNSNDMLKWKYVAIAGSGIKHMDNETSVGDWSGAHTY